MRRMLRKRAALLLVIAMVLAMMVPVMAAGTPTVKIEAPESVRAGETFEVRVVIENNPGLNAVQFTVGYDQKTLRCDACSTGSVLRGTLSATNADGKDGAVLAAASVNPAEDDGTLGVLKFTALADGDPKLTLRDTVFVNADSDEIDVTVTATGTTPGQTDDKTTDKPFTDTADIPAYARAAVYWAVYHEIWCGTDSLETGTTLAPREPATRAQIAVMITRYLEQFSVK